MFASQGHLSELLKTVVPMANPFTRPYVSGFSDIVGVTSVGIFTFELKFGCLGLWATEEDRRTWVLLYCSQRT